MRVGYTANCEGPERVRRPISCCHDVREMVKLLQTIDNLGKFYGLKDHDAPLDTAVRLPTGEAEFSANRRRDWCPAHELGTFRTLEKNPTQGFNWNLLWNASGLPRL